MATTATITSTLENKGLQQVPNLDLSARTSVEFSVKSLAGPHVILNLASGGLFEVIIGWDSNNVRSTIRRGPRRGGTDLANVRSAARPLSPDAFRTFVLDWSNRVLRLLSKSSSGELTEILRTPEQPDASLVITSMQVTMYQNPAVFIVQVPCPPR